MNGKISVNGTHVSAPKWVAAGVPMVTACIGALIAILSMLLLVPSTNDLRAAVDDGERIAIERWSGHQRSHDSLDRRLERIEEKLDRLLAKRTDGD